MNNIYKHCEWCDEVFSPRRRRGRKQKYCSKKCALEANHATRKAQWGQRLHDGMRLLSDDFGQLNGDESATFQK